MLYFKTRSEKQAVRQASGKCELKMGLVCQLELPTRLPTCPKISLVFFDGPKVLAGGHQGLFLAILGGNPSV